MSVQIVTKNSSTAGSAPGKDALVKGELAINVKDQKLFSKDNNGNVFELADGKKLANDDRYVKKAGDSSAQIITGSGGLKTNGLLESAGGVKIGGKNDPVAKLDCNGDAHFGDSVFLDKSLFDKNSYNSIPAIKCPFINDTSGVFLTQTSQLNTRAPIEILAAHPSNAACNAFNFTKGNVDGDDETGASNTSTRAGFIRISSGVDAAAGTVYNCGANTTDNGFVSSSDYRLKTDIQPMATATDRVKLLQPKNFRWIGTDDVTDGFIAHEVTAACPAAVFGEKDETEIVGTITDYDGTVLAIEVAEPSTEELTYTVDVTSPEGVTTKKVRTKTWTETGTRPIYQGVDQTKLIPLLTKALQEALEKIEALEAQLS